MDKKLEQGISKVIKNKLGLKRISSEVAVSLVKYLDTQDIVHKVDGQFPEIQSRLTERANADLVTKQGWSKTERLIKED